MRSFSLCAVMAILFSLASHGLAQSVSGTDQVGSAPATQAGAASAYAEAGLLLQQPQASLTSAGPQGATPICGFKHIGTCLANLADDERGIFTSPLRVQPKDAYWLAPLGAATGLALAYDADAAAKLGVDQSRIDTASNISDMGEFWAAGGESAGIYFIGLARKDPKLAETGRLAAESILASGTVTGILKLATNRERPNQGNAHGDFYTNGPGGWTWDSSFPSGHATASMALARVIAGEYPHWYVQVPAYGFAETVSITRVLALAHFPSDVLVGQAIGFLSANYVLNHRALYRPGTKHGLAARMFESIDPVVEPGTHTIGASIRIPTGR